MKFFCIADEDTVRGFRLAGIAGLSAGCYGQMNGYKTRIFELHDKPGGLCTSWNRKGYTFDGCIEWLIGAKPGSAMNRIWQELGAAQRRPLQTARPKPAESHRYCFMLPARLRAWYSSGKRRSNSRLSPAACSACRARSV